ncbi:MAG: type III pantothenate kinase [Candidatus Eisenbacteria bacterium]|nr:type III pantothenate kinase [Candidatus Eisenbacteria bacterium]
MTKEMLLAIDVGNTNIVIGVFDGEKLTKEWRLSTSPQRTADEDALTITNLLDGCGIDVKSIKGVVISSVVPSLTPGFEEMARTFLNVSPVTISSGLKLGIKILYLDPSSVGADRIANAVAAMECYGKPAVIVDLGTATTFDVVSEDGSYAGGVIAPGMGTSAEELFRRGARLARVELRAPAKVIGRTTEESLQSGIVHGTASQIDGLVEKITKEMGLSPKVILTGGNAPIVSPLLKTPHTLDVSLTLAGLRILHERNRPSARV